MVYSRASGQMRGCKGFRCNFGHIGGPLSTSCVINDKKVAQSISWSVWQWCSDHRIRQGSMVSLDIMITLTLCKLAHLLSSKEFRLRDRIHSQPQPRYMVCTDALFGRTFEQKNWKCVWNCIYWLSFLQRLYAPPHAGSVKVFPISVVHFASTFRSVFDPVQPVQTEQACTIRSEWLETVYLSI